MQIVTKPFHFVTKNCGVLVMFTAHNKNRSLIYYIIVSAFLIISRSASALTGQDILDNMNSDQSHGYLFGSIEMAAFLSNVNGNTDRSRCIINWYNNDGGVNQIIQALGRFKDREAQPVIHVLIKKACGE